MGLIWSKSRKNKDTDVAAEKEPNDEPSHAETNTEPKVLGTPENKKFLDPRSPFVCRTPIESISNVNTPVAVTKRLNLTTDEQNLSTPNHLVSGTQKNFLQQKLLKNLGYQTFDPRSPTQFINRTPIRLEDAETSDESLYTTTIDLSNDAAVELPEISLIEDAEQEEQNQSDMDKTTNLQNNQKSTPETEKTKNEIEDCVNNPEKDVELIEANINLEKENDENFIFAMEADPRSPSVNVERTPIVFNVQPVQVGDLAANNEQPKTKPLIYEDEPTETDTDASIHVVAQSPKTGIVPKSANNRTPLSCLGNQKTRPSLNHQQATKKPKHPILFIGQHQTATNPKALGNNNNQNNVSSKIPVYKSSIL